MSKKLKPVSILLYAMFMIMGIAIGFAMGNMSVGVAIGVAMVMSTLIVMKKQKEKDQ